MINGCIAKQGHSLRIKSPFPDNLDLFDCPDSGAFADAEIVIPGREQPLHLHRCILSRASGALNGIFRCKASAHGLFSVEAREINGFFETFEGDEPTFFVEWLRFCYGAPLSVPSDNAPAFLVMLPRLQLCKSDSVQRELEEYIISVAKNSFQIGITMLCQCASFEELKSGQFSEICKTLAQTVFTQSNFMAHSETIVKCLMELPFEYLDMIQYGNVHTDTSEFAIRKKYVLHNEENLSLETKVTIMRKCDWKKLNSAELKELSALGVISTEEFANLCLERAEKCEAHIQYLNAQIQEEQCKTHHYCKYLLIASFFFSNVKSCFEIKQINKQLKAKLH